MARTKQTARRLPSDEEKTSDIETDVTPKYRTSRVKQTVSKRKQLAVRQANKMPEGEQKQDADEEEETEVEEETDEEEAQLQDSDDEPLINLLRKKESELQESDDEPSTNLLRARFSKPRFPLQTPGQTARMQAKKVIEVLEAHAASPALAFAVFPITMVEVDAFLTRIRKLRVAAKDRALTNAKRAFVRMLEKESTALTRGFRESDHHQALRRLRTINAENTAEYTRRMQAQEEGDESDEDAEEFSLVDHFFKDADVNRLRTASLGEAKNDDFCNMVNGRLHEWLQSVLNFLPIVGAPSRTLGSRKTTTTNTCTSTTLERKLLWNAFTMDNPQFASTFSYKLADLEDNEVKIPEPDETVLRRAMKFYVSPITEIPNDTYELMRTALIEHLLMLVEALNMHLINKKIKHWTVCDPTTSAGKIPRKPYKQSLYGATETLAVFGAQIASDEEDSEQTDNSEQEDSDDDF